MTGFDWRNYLQLAARLAPETDEAAKRTAVSRAYYYVFHLALARVEDNGYVATRQAGSHIDVWRIYEHSPVPECKQLSEIGQRLQEWRVKADYRSTFPGIDRTVQSAVANAEQFAKIFARVDPRHPKQSSQRH